MYWLSEAFYQALIAFISQVSTQKADSRVKVFMIELLLGILLFGLIIFIHELGHFVAARLVGVRVITFSVGFGKRLCERRFGDTLWCISAIPLGGYVRPYYAKDDAPDIKPGRLLSAIAPLSDTERQIVEEFEKAKRGNLDNATFLQKLFFLSNGLIFNVLTAYLALALGTLYFAQVRGFVTEPRIGKVFANSPAAEAGLQRNDLLLAINGTRITTWSEAGRVLRDSPGSIFALTVERGNTPHLNINLNPKRLDQGRTDYGFSAAREIRDARFLESFRAAAISLPRIGTDLIKATLGIEDEKEFKGDPELSANWGLLGGIIGVGVFASESTESFLNIFIVISIAVVLLNAVPYPAFDGGQIFVLFIEKLRGEELSFLMKERIAFFGLASSVLLTVAAFGSDIYTTITLVFFG